MGKTITQSKEQTEMKRAEQLMRSYAELSREKDSISEQFKEALAPTIASMKAAEEELIEIGKRNRKSFDEDKNLVLEHGYIHIADHTQVKIGDDFSLTKFLKKFSNYVDISFKVAQLKKAWFDGDKRGALMAHDLELKLEDVYQIKVAKQKADESQDAK